jgi:hypothetical protein
MPRLARRQSESHWPYCILLHPAALPSAGDSSCHEVKARGSATFAAASTAQSMGYRPYGVAQRPCTAVEQRIFGVVQRINDASGWVVYCGRGNGSPASPATGSKPRRGRGAPATACRRVVSRSVSPVWPAARRPCRRQSAAPVSRCADRRMADTCALRVDLHCTLAAWLPCSMDSRCRQAGAVALAACVAVGGWPACGVAGTCAATPPQ